MIINTATVKMELSFAFVSFMLFVRVSQTRQNLIGVHLENSNSISEKQTYVALKNDLANDEKYIELFKSKEPIWYGNYDMTKTAYSDINEFCASYIGMWYYNIGKYEGLDNME